MDVAPPCPITILNSLIPIHHLFSGRYKRAFDVSRQRQWASVLIFIASAHTASEFVGTYSERRRDNGKRKEINNQISTWSLRGYWIFELQTSGAVEGLLQVRLDLLLGSRVELAIRNGSPSRRGEMLRQVTDLFVLGASQCTNEHITFFDHIITRLAVDIEISARALLATRLAPIPNAPPGVIRKLALDDVIEVAAPVLSQSERLDDLTLVEAVTTKSQEHLFAISRRCSLGAAVTDVLVELGDQRVARSTAENRGAKFSEHGLSQLVYRSEGDDELATSLGSRTDIPPKIFLMLLEKASESVRAKLESMHPHRNSEVRLVVAEVVSRIRAIF